ncbi:potassium/sodium hyperpolarization-activated cyclic nucleotide-gated channel 1-like [Agrilus planipennis]|uniref:Potassium/sodium hyperpolarization-activated cyclic nucleotide-gated channel 1-like n=1 Tax=Agrilus planipennis TaxID=224129 RepID=A0A1W4X4S7_AGRPL|nr:potassium/sodium hyperpolarization-activated cyclic nucleotide-gated channel 1-like [Agrilus planipennis]XP_018331122.1 potassium/sodium hyperpolarization-activated cyclic nucleotide-gated channel 1-like [Agrilus planipennis]XP_018331124.1 potassium/sodium hyperpolarization-activated cyclic nucleotide-gated channel 1-like [Agrilus planipennis]
MHRKKGNSQQSRYFVKFNHVCDIVDLEDPVRINYPGDDLCSRLKRTLARWRTVSDYRRDNRILRSQGVVRDERNRHFENYPYMIHPISDFRKWWGLHMIVVMALVLFLAPINSISFWSIASKFYITLTIFKLTVLYCDFVLIINFILNFFTGTENIAEKRILMDRREIAIHYLKGYFWADVWTIIPIQFISLFLTTQLAILFSLQFTKAMTYVSFLKYYKEFSENFNVNYTKQKMILLVCSIMFYFQWVTCFLMFIYLWNCGVLKGTMQTKEELIEALNLKEPITQLTYLNANGSYTGALYRATMIILLIDYGRAPPYNNVEKMVVIMIWVVSKLVYVQILSYIFQVLKANGSPAYKYTETLKQLKEYMSHKHLPVYMQRRVLDYYEFRFQNTYFKEKDILNTISNHLRQEVTMHSCGKLVENVTFFKNLPIALLVRIVSCLDTEIYLANDIISKAKSVGNCMFFIASGTVAVYTQSGKEVCHLEDGAHFGEIALVSSDSRRVTSVIAVEVCELFKLSRDDFVRAIMPYPDLLENIKKIAAERIERVNVLEEQLGYIRKES